MAHGGRGHWALYCTSPQSFMITLSYIVGLTTLGTLNFD